MDLECRAKAMLLRTFCEQAADPMFRHSLYLETLFRQEVLGEYCGGAKVPLPPYYGPAFFGILRKYRHNGPKMLELMTIKDWTQILTRDNITHLTLDPIEEPILRPLAIESSHNDVNWAVALDRARTPGLPSDLASMLFKVMHNILPTQERQARFEKGLSQGSCDHCITGPNDDIVHSFTACSLNKHNFEFVNNLINFLSPGTEKKQTLFLNFRPLLRPYELAACTCIAEGLRFMWYNRVRSRSESNILLKASITARANILNLTEKHKDTAEIMLEALKNVPP